MAYTGVREVAPGELFVVYGKSDAHPDEARGAKYNTMGRTVSVRRV